MKTYQTAQRAGDERATEETFCDFGRYTLDPHLRMLRSGARVVPIQSICFDLLFALLRSNHHTMSKDDLIASAWPAAQASDANLAQRISHLRDVLGSRTERNRYIVTIPKQGYRFVARTTYRSHRAAWCSAPGVDREERRRITRAQTDFYERRAPVAPRLGAERDFILTPIETGAMEAMWARGGWSTIADVAAERDRVGNFAVPAAALDAVFKRLCALRHLERREEDVDVFRPVRTHDDFHACAIEVVIDGLFDTNRNALLGRVARYLADDDGAPGGVHHTTRRIDRKTARAASGLTFSAAGAVDVPGREGRVFGRQLHVDRR